MVSAPVDQDAIDVGVRANDLTKNDNFAILHTLACVYAQAGKISQAREVLLKAMETLHVEEPNSEIWFGFASIAEQYGSFDAADAMYRRVEKPQFDYPGTSYVISQQRLAGLRRNLTAKRRAPNGSALCAVAHSTIVSTRMHALRNIYPRSARRISALKTAECSTSATILRA